MGTPNTREFDEVLRSLCSPWREEFDCLEPRKKAMVSELRFRTGCPVSLTIRGEPWFMDQQGLLQKAPIGTARRPTQPEMMNWLPPSVTIRSIPMPRRSGRATSVYRVGAGQDFADRLS